MINFNNAVFELSAGNFSQLPASNLPEIVFSGRSNVGKSTLINKILNRKSLARVSTKPGKTITINFYNLSSLKFIDLPGYGYAKISFSEKKRWSDLVENYFNSERKILLLVQLIDFRHPPSVQDFEMLDYLYNKNINFIVYLTKTDKLNKTNYEKRNIELNLELIKYKNIIKIFELEELKKYINNIEF